MQSLDLKVITVRVEHGTKTGSLKIIWGYESYFPPYHIDSDMVQRKSKAVRERLQKLVEYGVDNGLEHSGKLLKKLTEAGFDLYHALFLECENTGTPDKVKNWLNNLAENNYRINFINGPRIHIPWGLVYSSDPKAIRSNVDNTDVANYKDFWCLKYYLSTLYERITPTCITQPRLHTSFGLLPVINKGAFEKALSYLENTEQIALDELFKFCGGAIYSSDELYDTWGSFVNKDSLLYFYSHANGENIALDAVDEISIDDFRLKLRREQMSEAESVCMVFLNGCSTASGAIGGGFLEATGSPGFCGFIGTETKIPDVFALRFGLEFFHYFLYSGLPLFQIMKLLKVQHWPLSLVYGIYCHPLLRLIPAEKPKYDLLKMNGRNFSFGTLGTAEL